jgi:hypothetical protein
MSKARCGGITFCDVCKEDAVRVLGDIQKGKSSMRIEKYTTRPDSVEAVHLTRENINEVAIWCGGDTIVEAKSSDHTDVYMALTVPRANGPIDAQIGMYILKNARGRFEVSTQQNFEAKYGRSTILANEADKIMKRVDEGNVSPEEARALAESSAQAILGQSAGSARIKSYAEVEASEAQAKHFGGGPISLDIDDHVGNNDRAIAAQQESVKARHTLFGKPSGR